MRELIFGKELRSRIIRYNFLIICVIAVFVSVCTYVTASRRTLEVARNSLQHHVENVSYRYQLAYVEMINIMLNCTERKSFSFAGIGDTDTSAARKKAMDYVQILQDYCSITEYGDYIVKLAVFDDRGHMVQTGSAYGSTNDADIILDADWFAAEQNKPINQYPLELVPSPFFHPGGNILPIVRSLGETNGRPAGWVVLCLSQNLFQDVLKDTAGEQETVVVTADGRRLAAIREPAGHEQENDRVIRELQASGELQGLTEMRVHGKNSLVAFERHPLSGVMVYEMIPLNQLSGERDMIIQTVIIMFASCLIVGFILSVVTTNQIKKPIDRLVKHIGEVANGNFARDSGIEGEDEIGRVGVVVNHMSERINLLMEQRLEDEKEKGDLELKMLQAQINPHFLYNTLDSIRWIAVIQKNSGIVKMVTALSGLLKNMAKGFNEKVTLRKELEFLDDYVTIEKVKYVELFDLEIRVDEPELYDALIIKLTLQPLVENAIFCGIEPGGKHGTILIHALRENDCLVIKVRDNGRGIPGEKLKTIIGNTERVKGSSMSGIGLPNVERRIKLNYGQEYGLTIASEEGSYTEITVKIPLEYDTMEAREKGRD